MLSLSAAVLAVVLAGCGSNESSPGPAKSGVPAQEGQFLGFTDPTDTSVTAVRLSVSSEYDADRDVTRIFALPKDQDGHTVFNLNQNNFNVVLNSETAPTALPSADTVLTTEATSDKVVALVIDSSGSMIATDPDTGKTRIQAAKEAAKLFVSLMGPTDRAAVVTFNTDARTVEPLTGDADALNRAIDSLKADGVTNFGAAIGEGVRAVGTRPGKRAMILLTDGDDTVDTVTGDPSAWLGDTASSRFQGLVLAQQNEFRVYTVGLGADLSDTGLADLRTIAGETGGTFFQAPTAGSLLAAFGATIPREIDGLSPVETYVLTFPNPVHPRPGKVVDVPFRLTVRYDNANGRLTDKAVGSYQVP
jgi:hypothetical protein